MAGSPGPAADTGGQPQRNRIAALIVLGALVIAPITGFAACARNASATKTAAEQLRELAHRMELANDVTYTATYSTAGLTVTHAQEPPRQAYRSGSTTLIMGPDTVILCRPAGSGPSPAGAGAATSGGAATSDGAAPPTQATTGATPHCEQAPGMDGITLAQARAVGAAVAAPHLVAPEAAVALLLRAAARPQLTVTPSQQKLAGADADCATVQTGAGTAAGPDPSAPIGDAGGAGAATSGTQLPPLRFLACVTAKGVLARFEGSTDLGAIGQMTMVRLALTADAGSFEAPSGAAVQDAAVEQPAVKPVQPADQPAGTPADQPASRTPSRPSGQRR